MAIYTCFIQHVINSLKNTGKGAIVVPISFITALNSIERKILEYIVDNNIVYGCVSMPANVFANTQTKVSTLFFDKSKQQDKVVLIDATKLGIDIKDGKKKKHKLLDEDIESIIDAFHNKKVIKEFSVVVTHNEIKENNYSLAAGQYFDVEIEYIDITEDEFNSKIHNYENNLKKYLAESNIIKDKIFLQLEKIKFQ